MTMLDALDPTDLRLLDEWQRGFPLVPRPFAEIGAALGLSEAEVIDRLRSFVKTGAVTRIGATCRPNTAGASTLAAVAAPDSRIEEVAAVIGAEPGVNHSYLRENQWNIWFVATGPSRIDVDAALWRIEQRTGLRVLDLPLVRPFNVDLGFSFDGSRPHAPTMARAVDISAVLPSDRSIIQALSSGLELVERPFRAVAEFLGRDEDNVIERIQALTAAGIFARVGVIVRHRALGWRANAMVVWQVPEPDIEEAGMALATTPGVTLCYQRRPVPVLWPYSLYCMIHARSRSEAFSVLARAREIGVLANVHHDILFSVRCFRQRGALIDGNRRDVA